MLLLKRFEFDYGYISHVKINCTVDVCCTLQIPEVCMYTVYFINFYVYVYHFFYLCFVPWYHCSELYVVVGHFGDLRSGHHTATRIPGWWEVVEIQWCHNHIGKTDHFNSSVVESCSKSTLFCMFTDYAAKNWSIMSCLMILFINSLIISHSRWVTLRGILKDTWK